MWNMASPQEFWNHKFQTNIFTPLASDPFLGVTQAQEEVVQSTFFPEQGWTFEARYKYRTLNFPLQNERSPVHLWESQPTGLWVCVVGCFKQT